MRTMASGKSYSEYIEMENCLRIRLVVLSSVITVSRDMYLPIPARRLAAARPVVEGGEIGTSASVTSRALHRFEATTHATARGRHPPKRGRTDAWDAYAARWLKYLRAVHPGSAEKGSEW